MKICIFTPGWLPVHWNFGAGGIEIHVLQLVNNLMKRGHQITIITTRHPQGIEKETIEGLNIYYVGDKPMQCTGTFYRDSVYLFKSLNMRERFDIVHSQDYAGYGFAKHWNGNPHIVTSHGTPINVLKSILEVGNYKSSPKIPLVFKSHFSIAPVIFKKCDRIVTVSNELNEDIKCQYKIPGYKIITIPNGIDENKFKPIDSSELKKKIGIETDKLILFVGGISKQKGLHILINSFLEIYEGRKDIALLIIGSGPYLNKIKKKINKFRLDNEIVFIDKLQNDELPQYYNMADVLVVPSLGMEGLPLVVIEAMSCGIPIIASRLGGIPTAIENMKNGILFEPGNALELSEKILELLNNKELADNFGKAGRKRAIEQFSLDRMVEQTIRVYEKCIN